MAETVYKLTINKKILESIVSFDCENNDDLVANDNVMTNDYAAIYVKENAVVTYTISCKGYETISNTLTVNKNITLTPDMKKLVTLTIVVEPVDSTIIFEYQGNTYKQSSIDVLTSTPVKYTIKRKNRETVSDTIILERDTTLNISLSLKLNTDGDMAKYEGEYSDPLADIHLIKQKDYDNLTDDLRSKYVKYSDMLSRFMGVDYDLTLNDCIVQLYWMLPIVHKLTPFTNGTLGGFQTDFLSYLSQLNALFAAAEGIKDKLNGVRKALNKVGLGSLIDIFTTGFGLIGGLAGIVYGIMNNPDIFIKTYYQAFQDINLEEIYNRTIKETLPNLDYVKGMLNRTYIPDGDLKKYVFDRIDQIDAAADLSLDVLGDLESLKTMVNVANSSEEAMKTLIENMSTFSLQWALGSLSKSISRLKLDKDKIKSSSNNTQLADAYKVMRDNLDKILNDQENYYIHEDDLLKLNMADNTNSTQKIMDYQNGYNDAFENAQNGETEEEKNIRLAKIKAEMEKLGQDPSGYIYGYNIGWTSGNRIYIMEKNHLTEEQEKSYQNGYIDGYNFRSISLELAEDSKEIGYLKWGLDIDNHIHGIEFGTNLTPYGRIEPGVIYSYAGNKIGRALIKSDKVVDLEGNEIGIIGNNIDLPIKNHKVIGYIDGIDVYDFNGNVIGTVQEDGSIMKNDVIIGYKKNVYYALDNNKNILGYIDERGIVYDFHEDMTENPIGTYDFESCKIYITSEEKYYLMVNTMYIYDTDIEEEREVKGIRDLLHNFNEIRVERNAPVGNLNPYYADGWNKGYQDRTDEDNKNDLLLSKEQLGKNDGYLASQNDKTFDECNAILYEYEKQNENDHPDYYEFYSRGFHTGYNQYQSEYNSTYTKGWYMCTQDEFLEFNYSSNDYTIVSNVGIVNDKICTKERVRFFEQKVSGKYRPFGYIINDICYDWDGNVLGTYISESVSLSGGGTGFREYYQKGNGAIVDIGYVNYGDLFYQDDEVVGYIDMYNQENIIKESSYFIINDEVVYVDTNNVGKYIDGDVALDSNGDIIGIIKDNIVYDTYNTKIGKIYKDDIIPFNTYTKEDFLNSIINEYNIPEYNRDKNSYYRGANNGWDDKYNGLEEPIYRENFY